MMNCDTIQRSVGAWLDGELSGSDADAVRTHLQGCVECDRERQRLETLQAVLKSVLDAETSRLEFEPFWRAVQQRMSDEPGWRRRLGDWSHTVFARPGLAWAVPLVIALLIGVASFDPVLLGLRPAPRESNFAAVESINAYGRNIALLRENETRTTVIWLFQYQEGEYESTGEASEPGAPF